MYQYQDCYGDEWVTSNVKQAMFYFPWLAPSEVPQMTPEATPDNDFAISMQPFVIPRIFIIIWYLRMLVFFIKTKEEA